MYSIRSMLYRFHEPHWQNKLFQFLSYALHSNKSYMINISLLKNKICFYWILYKKYKRKKVKKGFAFGNLHTKQTHTYSNSSLQLFIIQKVVLKRNAHHLLTVTTLSLTLQTLSYINRLKLWKSFKIKTNFQ